MSADSAPMLNVVHVSPRVQAGGGIESLHEYHRRWPLRQMFVAMFDRRPESRTDYINLGVDWRTSLWDIRRRFKRAMLPLGGGLVVYHDAWGLPLLCGVDGAARRIAYFHADPAYYSAHLSGLVGLLDGAAVLAPEMDKMCQLPPLALASERIVALRAPIEGPKGLTRPRERKNPLILGYAGRLERAQKRCDRIPALVRSLRDAGIDFRFEVLGDGSMRHQLETALAGQVTFHGWMPKSTYWEVLSQWDAMVFFSEHEAGPIALLEGMAAGVLPFCPWMGGSWGDFYAPQIDPACQYPTGDIPGLVSRLKNVFSQSADRIATLRDKARAMVVSHDARSYEQAGVSHLEYVARQPRISAIGSKTPRVADLLPLGLATRLKPGIIFGPRRL